MPELPEVETTRRGIEPAVRGRCLRAVTVREGRLRQPVPADLAASVAGAELRAVRRRGKYLLFDFDHGSVLLHLGMSGSLRVVEAGSEPGRHDHVDLVFGSDAVLRYRDPRRFGLILWQAGAAEAHPLLARLGIEPLAAEFDGAWLFAATRGSKVAIKSWLMDAHRVVGVGNIYASESLFGARIHPLTPAGTLGRARCARLAHAVQDTLRAAIALGGSSLRDYGGGDGAQGYFMLESAVYGRAGEPCRTCGTPIERRVLAQRATYWCPRCQRRR